VSETVLRDEPGPASIRPGVLGRLARRAVLSRLRRISGGEITLRSGDAVERRGQPDADLATTVSVRDPGFYRSLALRGHLGAAEAYMDDHWRCDDLTGLIRIMARSRGALEALDRGLARAARVPLRLLHAVRRNTRGGSRRNITAHYDLGNDFFALFLDPTWTYSCGIFEDSAATMEEASAAKYERVCRKLGLERTDHVLEIGGGWGGFAIHAAGRYGCRVTTTTISRAQYELARKRVAEAGLSDRVEILLEDYRELRGEYDKLASIEMIEAVGHRYLDAFFRVCSERLRPQGRMLLQAITVPDQAYELSKRSVDFIKRYIFPGGQLVSIGAVCSSVARTGDMRPTQLEDITPHYAETLRRWRTRMFENLDRVRALGLPDRFVRMWEFYLCYCEGGFRERAIGAIQLLFEKPLSRAERFPSPIDA
jgi:cyclopropane-fatty-acyl-phospholipid synthase